jgi:plastocyanin
VRGRLAAALSTILVTLPMLAAACSLPGAATVNDHERTVLVDYHFDQFAAVWPAYFPKELTVRQGDTIVFKQFWSGEPHSITAGALVDEVFNVFWPALRVGPPFPSAPPSGPEFQAAQTKLQALPSMYSNSAAFVAFAQNGAQPCYLDTGAPPSDDSKACTQRAKPAFTGAQSYYSSGILPYQGEQGNLFKLPIAADAAPGTHYYYCNLHGPLMSGAFTIVAKTASIPSQAQVNSDAQKLIARYTDPAGKAYKDALAGKSAFKPPLSGTDVPPDVFSEITEFVPRSIKAKVGEKVTWHVLGDLHTISFDVPKYLPEVVIDKDGTVRYSDQVLNPVGAPGFPQDAGSGGPTTGPPPAISIDAGRYDGSHFLSSGLGGPQGGPGSQPQEVSYSVTFSKAGTYKYACLVHPLMVGEVVVQ